MRRLGLILAALLVASPAGATWTEIVGTGGPTSGRLRWARTDSNYVMLIATGTVETGRRWRLDATPTLLGLNIPDFGGSGTDEYYALNAYYTGSAYRFAYQGHQENGVADRAYIYSGADAGAGSEHGAVNTSATGATLGFVYGLVTHNSRDRWALATATPSSTSNAAWYGGTGLPGTAADDTENISTSGDIRYNEGCVASETTTPVAYGVLVKTDGTLVISQLVASGAFETTTTVDAAWGSGDTIQVGQCFMVGVRFVAVAYNATEDETFVGIYSSTPVLSQSQIIAGQVFGGVALDGTGYIMASDGTLYMSDGTATFADASDDYGDGAPLLLSLNAAGDAVLVWDADGDISERSAGSAPTVTTGSATSITRTGATLGGTVNPNSLSTAGEFDYGLTASYGSTASAGDLGSGSSNVASSASITGLACATTYHFRAAATNSVGETNGDDATFTTAACVPTVRGRSAGTETGRGSTGWSEVGWR